ncbi:MAG: hypothetical protein FWE17_00330 [Alphaproteobacteria bacterium]|nr:hypothetical protein [Alphaproteobacteria bacterium]MCL2757743.1 hypothetical protein [Alphaproteobacteria bacterium]
MTRIEKFDELAAFYEQMKTVMAAVCVRKGGVPIESYTGRFFAADVLEMLVSMGGKERAGKYANELAAAKELVTPSVKPMHEMTLEEFEKVMNI